MSAIGRVLAVGVMSCAASVASAATHYIEVADFAFIPASITVAPGDTIIWTATGINPHTIVSGSNCMPDGDFFWGGIPNGGGDGPPNMTFGWVVPSITAEIPYMCIAHCGMGMTGHISVVSGGGTIQVPGDHATIQGAIDAATDGDTISIAAGTYLEYDLALGDKGITLSGATDEDGNPAVIIDAQQQGRVMTIAGDSASGLAPLVEHLVFTGGSSQLSGGGLNCTNSNAFIRNCHFINNASDMNGGGVYHSGGSTVGPPPHVVARFARCQFTGNSADEGGGLHSRIGVLQLTNCIVTDNSANIGGGLSQCECKYSNMVANTTIVCGNTPDQIDGPINLGYGSCASSWCDDSDGDGSPDGCVYDNDGILNVPDEYETILMALENAVDGNTIAIAAGTYLLNEGDELGIIQGMSLSIIGEANADGSPAVTIDGQGGASGIHYFGGTDDSGTIDIADLHITRCLYPMTLQNCSGTVKNCHFDTNYGLYGVISIINAAITVDGCVMQGNQGTFCGGVQVTDNGGYQVSDVSLIDCVIEGNAGTYPYYAVGGVSLYDGHTTIVGCTISDNISAGIGGVFVDGSATASLTNTMVCGNVGLEGDTTQTYGDWTDDGGNTITDECEDCTGDLDGNGQVTIDDLLALLAAYQSNGNGDCDGDGDTDIDDLLILIGVWGPCNA